MTTRIITHAGQAHFDEVLACALILAQEEGPVEILRRDPTAEELADPTVWVVDVGGRFEPELRNFDHHQAKDLPAAFKLVAASGDFMLDELASQVYPWWTVASDIDAKGPFAAAKGLGISPDALFALQSPLQAFLIRRFQADPNGVVDLLREFGADVIGHLNCVSKRLEELRSMATITHMKGVKVIKHAINYDPSLAMEIFRREMGDDAGISVTPDDRGQGYTLYRFHDDKRVNFSKLEGHADILFAHKGGFIAKTKDRSCDIRALLEAAIV